MKQIVDQAIILRRVNYGESDRVVTALTAKCGKISLFAKGVRKPKSRLSSGIELLSLSEIYFIDGKSDLKTLTGARLLQYHDQITKNLDATNRAFEALKKIDKISDDDAGQEYFGTLNVYLSSLNDRRYENDIVDAWFSMRLMKIAGVLADISVQPRGTTNDINYRFDFDNQFFEPHLNGIYTKDDIKLINLLSRSAKPVVLSKPYPGNSSLITFSSQLYKGYMVH